MPPTKGLAGRKAKFLVKKGQLTPLRESKPLRIELYKMYLEARIGKGREELPTILKFIIERGKESPDGWVPYPEILTHMKEEKFDLSRSRMNQIMINLEKHRITIRQKRKNLVFYKISGEALTPVLTDYGVRIEYLRLKRANNELSNKLVIAESILSEHDLMDNYESELQRIHDENERKKARRRRMSKDEILRDILQLTPDEMTIRNKSIESSQAVILLDDLKKLKQTKNDS